ncbi:MAG: hypothetical protein O2888_01215 [Chloroflexi bacterium]|nr:hypothetical protein [Chloroflexota bacterium]MQC47945.1 hypothetical protein [Chloroflexota bacterium]
MIQPPDDRDDEFRDDWSPERPRQFGFEQPPPGEDPRGELEDDFEDDGPPPGQYAEAEAEPALSAVPPRLPNPRRPDPPRFAPVVFDDDEEDAAVAPRGPRSAPRYESDAGLLRVLGVIAVLGIVILALVLPFSPFSVIGGGSDGAPGGISATARDSLPPLPEGLVALSKLYDIAVPEGIAGPLSVEIQLSQPLEEASNVAYYGWDGERWQRIGLVQVAGGGASVTGSIPASSGSIAVLQRTSLAHSLGLIVEAGEAPDPSGVAAASVIVVMAAALQADGTLTDEAAALRPARQAAAGKAVYLGVGGDLAATPVTTSSAGITAHADAIVAAVQRQDADGVYLEYTGVSPADGAWLVDVAGEVKARLGEAGVIIGVPAGDAAYPIASLLDVADAVWVRGPADPVEFHRTVGTMLTTGGITDASRVSLIVDRRSTLQSADGTVRQLTLIEALTVASTIDFNVDAIGPGSPVALRTAYLGGGPDGLIHWDPAAFAVSFTYSAGGQEHQLWFQNEYSFAHALHAAAVGGFGGVVVAPAAASEVYPAVWEPVAQYV